MARDLLTPVYAGGQLDLARGLVFRKQILPETTINYEGRKLVFDRQYLTDLAQAFRQGAYDQVPFTLADADNKHTMDPERIRGELTSVSLAEPGESPGLYATIAFPNTEAAKAVTNNPRLGVSCRIREGVAKSDGRSYSKAIVHVCGTPDPRVTGMSPWRKVDLSGYEPSKTVIDLSTSTYVEAQMPKQKQTAAEEVDFSQWTDEELRAIAGELGVTDEDVQAFLDSHETSEPGQQEQEPGQQQQEQEPEPVGAGADLSVVHQAAIDAGRRADEALKALADTQWANERNGLLGAGIPEAAINLAEPYLSAPGGFTVDLSNSEGGTETADVAGDMRKMLALLGGFVDLTSEQGHGGQFNKDSDTDPDKAMLDSWDAQFPG
jgi:hypothetical protein